MGAASAKPKPCRLVMIGLVPAENLRVCLDSIGRPEVVDHWTGESFTQGGHVTHSMMRLPDERPFLLKLRRHGLHIDAVTALEALPSSVPSRVRAEKYLGLILVVDAASTEPALASVEARQDARKMMEAILQEIDTGSQSNKVPVVVLVTNCKGRVTETICRSVDEYLGLGELPAISTHNVPAKDDARMEIYEALDWLSARLQQRQ